MTKAALKDLTVQQLVEEFVQIGVDQDQALLSGEIAKFNRLFARMADVSSELRGREGDQRHALLALYIYPNVQVQLKAAKHTLAIAPSEARNLIQKIADSNWFPQSGEAGMSLWNLDRGVFKPT